MIDKYEFGSINIDGTTYDYDVEVRWSPQGSPHADPAGQVGEVLKWWRKESHVFALEDLKRAVEQNPDTIILGTGAYGLAEVPERTREFIKAKGIRLIIDKTGEAVKTFNIISEESREQEGSKTKLIGLFHLTC